MKIALVSGIYPPDIGGPASFVPSFAEHLKANGHQVTVITLADKVNVSIEDDFKVTRIYRELPFFLRFLRTVTEICKLPAGTAIFANGLHEEVGIALALRHRTSVAKIVGDPVWERARNSHQTELSILEFNQNRLNLKYQIQRRLLKFALTKFDLVTCPSQELCHLVASWGVDSQVKFIANGVSVPTRTGLETKDFELIVVSRLVPWKNVDKCLELANSLNLRIAIVGSGPLESELRELANRLECDATFTGELEKSEVSDFLERARFFIQLSNYEGMSFSMLEAMSRKLPVIVSDITANTEVVRNGIEGIVVDLSNISSSVNLIHKVLNDEKMYEDMANKARLRVVEKFDEKKQFTLMEKFLI